MAFLSLVGVSLLDYICFQNCSPNLMEVRRWFEAFCLQAFGGSAPINNIPRVLHVSQEGNQLTTQLSDDGVTGR